jgi:hypothetical protein
MAPKSRVASPAPRAAEPGRRASGAKKDVVRTPRHYEFGGNVGTAFWTLFIPVCLFYAYGINVVNKGVPTPPTQEFWEKLIFGLPKGVALYPTTQGFLMLTAWTVLQALFQQFLPGKMEYGAPLKTGKRLPYKLNGWRSFCATWALVIFLVGLGIVDPTILNRHFGSLMVWANIYSHVIALYLYLDFGLNWRKWADSPEFESDWGVFTLKDFFHDYWMGTARNPRIMHFLGYPLDLKFFFEARPGLMLWILINWSNVAAMFYGCETHAEAVTCEYKGDISKVPYAALIVALSQSYYVLDYFWNEPAILSTTDIRHEPFGFMLMWGDFGFLPWMYTNSFTMYLKCVEGGYKGDPNLDILCICLWLLAMVMFRLANLEKHNFRAYAAQHGNNPAGYKVWGKPVTYIKTKEGSLMLTSGFWGLCRHPNYVPDLVMAFTWFLCCSSHGTTSSLIPLGYVIYFWSMDIHRFIRDERRCKAKYGDDWDKYVQAVPYCLIPGIW